MNYIRMFQNKSTGLAQRMGQYILAKRLQSAVPDLRIVGYDMPEWGLSEPVPPECKEPWPTLSRFFFNYDYIEKLIGSGKLSKVQIDGCPLHMSHLCGMEENSKLFVMPDDGIKGAGDDEMLIHIRSGDIMGGAYQDYGPLPIRYYRDILDKTGLEPVFCGQLENGRYLDEITKAFPRAKLVPPQASICDFQLIRKSKNIMLSMSSFCWLAAWLSDAKRIYYPLFGWMNPLQCPAHNLAPVSDARYSFVAFPVRHWHASSFQIDALFDNSISFQELSANEVQRMLIFASFRSRGIFFLKRCKFELQRSGIGLYPYWEG